MFWKNRVAQAPSPLKRLSKSSSTRGNRVVVKCPQTIPLNLLEYRRSLFWKLRICSFWKILVTNPLGLRTYINSFLTCFWVGCFERINPNLLYHSQTLSRIHQSNSGLLEGLPSLKGWGESIGALEVSRCERGSWYRYWRVSL